MKTAEEASTLTAAGRTLLSEVKQQILRYVPKANVLLYGSAARGQREPESDYDVLVLVDAPLSSQDERAMQDAVYDVELAHEAVVSVVIYSQEQWNSPLARVSPYHQRVEREAIVL